uniref:P-selectin-like n=1 Tax=Ciona intestinalis TaxID=7719 RepID=A0A1W2WHH8_CIOIN|nr:P-selectin-like [Ciona intestinalis]|eukprot:XP_002131250.1 P-selectin-like [Ciona intestinalis]
MVIRTIFCYFVLISVVASAQFCDPLPELARGIKKCNQDLIFTRCDFVCNEGLTIVGPSVTACIFGNWSSDMPTCEEPKMNEEVQLEGTPENQGKYFVGVCDKDPAQPENGAVTCLDILTLKYCWYSCDDGYTLNGLPSYICSAHQWFGEPPVCKLPDTSNKTQNGEQRAPVKSSTALNNLTNMLCRD